MPTSIASSCNGQGDRREELFLEEANSRKSHLNLWISIFVTHRKEKEASS